MSQNQHCAERFLRPRAYVLSVSRSAVRHFAPFAAISVVF